MAVRDGCRVHGGGRAVWRRRFILPPASCSIVQILSSTLGPCGPLRRGCSLRFFLVACHGRTSLCRFSLAVV
eukprot:764537-Hanusia_phi.AAC.2